MTARAQPPFIRDALNWEGRVREEWCDGDGQWFLIESAPGWVQVSTEVLRDLLIEAGYTKAADL